jgi:protein SCO1
MRTCIACVVVLLAAFVASYALTYGFNVFTSEDARRLDVLNTPRLLPLIHLIDSNGVQFNLQSLNERNHKVVIVDFFFARCASICLALGSKFQRLQSEIIERGVQDSVKLLSISFDPTHDTPSALAAYARRLHANPAVWQFATTATDIDRAAALGAFDVVVIADALSIYQHNSAIHLVDTQAKLARIIDDDEVDSAVNIALRLRGATLAQLQIDAP